MKWKMPFGVGSWPKGFCWVPKSQDMAARFFFLSATLGPMRWNMHLRIIKDPHEPYTWFLSNRRGEPAVLPEQVSASEPE